MNYPKKYFLFFIFCALIGAHTTLVAQNLPTTRQTTQAKRLWNLKEVDIISFIHAVANTTGKNFAIDPRVSGKVTFISSQPLDNEELYQAFLSVLQVHGFVALQSGKVTKIVPDFVAKGLSSPIFTDTIKRDGADAIAVAVVDVKYVPANDLATTLNQFLTPSGRIAAYAPTNDLMIADRTGNILHLMRLIKQIDQPHASRVKVIHLKNAIARQLVETLKVVLGQKTNAATANVMGLTLAADDRTNSILISDGATNQQKEVLQLIARLDAPNASPANVTDVIYLKHLHAERAATIVSGMIQNYYEHGKSTEHTKNPSAVPSVSSSSANDLFSTGNSNPNTNSTNMSTMYSPTSGFFSSNAPNNDISSIVEKIPKSGSASTFVQWEESTNSLVVTAPRDLMHKIKRVIAKLDIRRPQVLIEAVIAEVSTNKQRELGIEWNSSGTVSFRTSFLPILPLSYIGNNGKLATVAGGPDTVGEGMSTTFQGNQIRFLLRALETDRNSNVLATPNLVTLDNEPAQIKVGSKVSFATAQIQNNPTGGNPFNFFNREDVGLVLTINPQITPNGSIKLLIQQELSAIIPGTATVGGNPTTSERFIRTTVMADNGRVLVLGGLLQNQWDQTINEIPFLGNIPGLGNLFKDRAQQQIKTNLMIFLRPTILYNDKDDITVSGGKYEFLRQAQLQANSKNPFKHTFAPPVLPIEQPEVILPQPFDLMNANNQPPIGAG